MFGSIERMGLQVLWHCGRISEGIPECWPARRVMSAFRSTPSPGTSKQSAEEKDLGHVKDDHRSEWMNHQLKYLWITFCHL